MRIWLDDVREMPSGYDVHCRTVREIQELLKTGQVEEASLDHDLGICPKCTPGEFSGKANIVVVQSLESCCDTKTCQCHCHETGSHLVRWMAETGNWPKKKPRVHSANIVGAAYMRGVIDGCWREDQ